MAQTKINASQTTITAEDIGAVGAVTTLPTASASEEGKIYQFTGTTDANYTNGYFYKCVSDGAVTPTYSWTAVQVQASSGGLPSQSGQSGKFLTTDGTDASWGTINALTNNAPAGTTNSLMIDTTDTSGYNANNAISIGKDACSYDTYGVSIGSKFYSDITSAGSGVAIGAGANTASGVAIGKKASASSYNTSGRGVAIGATAHSSDYSIAIGYEASTSYSYSAIQLGNGTNNDEGTFKVALSPAYGTSHTNYELLSANGTIPTDRFTSTPVADGTYVPTLTISSGVASRSWSAPAGGATSATATLAVADWSNGSQTVNVTGVTASNNVIVAPAPASQSDYTTAGILCTAQGAGTLSFTCTTTPSSAITVNVLII